MKLPILASMLLVSGVAFGADEFVIGINEGNGEPYAIRDGETLKGGIIKDFGEALSAETKIPVKFKFTSRKRIEAELKDGSVTAACIHNPNWTKERDALQWSVPLFKEEKWLMVNKAKPLPIKAIGDLKGKKVGTILGFYYPKELSSMFASKGASREDVSSLNQNFDKLEKGRIDTFVDSNLQVLYHLKTTNSASKFEKADLILETVEIHCGITKNTKISLDAVNKGIEAMKTKGTMDAILKKYR